MRLMLLVLPDTDTMLANLLKVSTDPFYKEHLYPLFLNEAGEKKFPDGVAHMVQNIIEKCFEKHPIKPTHEQVEGFIRALISEQEPAEEAVRSYRLARTVTLPDKIEMLRRLRACEEHSPVYEPVFYPTIITAGALKQATPEQLVHLVFSAMQSFIRGMPEQFSNSEIELVPSFIRAIIGKDDEFFRRTHVFFEQMKKEVYGSAA